MKAKIIYTSGETTEYHEVNCSHICKDVESKQIKEFNASTLAELKYEIELDFNNDFAGDYGLTPAEYIAAGRGYKAGTKKGDDLQIFPCIKFAKAGI